MSHIAVALLAGYVVFRAGRWAAKRSTLIGGHEADLEFLRDRGAL